nr:DNA helicase [Kibdelosporangium sp. MJ126-NF4]CTQ98314.1 DNA helicase [Kibdelosporangium sp. MJ126-NF4]
MHDLASVPGATGYIKERPLHAIRYLSQLSNALTFLHDHGLAHRNLWPGAIDVESAGEDDDDLVLRLSRFEMSTLIANLLRSTTLDARSTPGQIRNFLLNQGVDGRALVYFSPERIDFLYPSDDGAQFLDDQASDVYGLGVIAWEWFFGPIAEKPPGDSERVRQWARQLRRQLEQRLKDERSLPRKLCDLIARMIAEKSTVRPSAGSVHQEIRTNYAALSAYFAATPSDQPFLVAFMPRESIPTVHEWGWVRTSPTTPDGRNELGAFLEEDLSEAVLVHAPHGAEPYFEAGNTAAKREAQHLLIGKRGAWFCQPFRPSGPLRNTAPAIEEVLLIKYVVPLDSHRARGIRSRLAVSPFQQRVSPIEAVAYDIHPAELRAMLIGRPQWTPMVEATRSTSRIAPHEMEVEQALDWLLEYQGVQLRAREYAYERVEDAAVNQVKLIFDHPRDRNRLHSSPLLAKYAASSRRRPPFADFFGYLAKTEESATIEVVGDDRGMPSRRAFQGEVRFHTRENETTILVVASSTTGRLPERGWLRPHDDVGSRVALQRQHDARWNMLDDRVLLDQLRNPLTINGFREPWQRAVDALPGKELKGKGGEVVVDMLVSQPFFAIQGPPGTGKTEIASRAIAAYVNEQPGDRVLVSAQANYALDNLALRVLRKLGAVDEKNRMVPLRDVVAVRVVAPSTDSVDDTPMAQFKIGEVVHRRRQVIADEIKEDIRKHDELWHDIRSSYLATLPTSLPELSDRFLRGANIVFATCLAATRRSLATNDASLFDWAVVEEAAKAWPGELAIPLSQGLRWSLLGDHRQLPAHRRDEVLDFLQECADDDHPDISIHGRRFSAYREIFEVFANLFEQKRVDTPRRMQRPLRTLDRQFRMRPPIGELVSRVFYPATTGDEEEWNGGPLPKGMLETAGNVEPHQFTTPGLLAGRDLIWLDTDGLKGCKNEGNWYNEGEVGVIAELVRRMGPHAAKGLVVLTPYREQAKRLREVESLAKRVWTIPAYQGHEEDVVIVSLVRDQAYGGPDQPKRNIGYLIQPELVNVMISRASKLLVIVGNHGHFAAVGDFWAKLCAGVEQFGVRLPAGRVFEQ